MHRKQNGPHDAAADKADVSQNLEVAEEEVGIEGAIVENVGIWDLEEGYDPVEQAGRQFRDGVPRGASDLGPALRVHSGLRREG